MPFMISWIISAHDKFFISYVSTSTFLQFFISAIVQATVYRKTVRSSSAFLATFARFSNASSCALNVYGFKAFIMHGRLIHQLWADPIALIHTGKG